MTAPQSDLFCSNCGAALAAPADLTATTAACDYCHGQTPLPPALVEARQEVHARVVAERIRAEQAQQIAVKRVHVRRLTARIITLVILVPVLIILVAVGAIVFYVYRAADQVISSGRTMMQQVESVTRQEEPPAVRREQISRVSTTASRVSTTASASGATTPARYTCTRGVTNLIGQTFSDPTGVAVTVTAGCRLTLVDCTVNGRVLVSGGVLKIVGGRYSATGSALVATGLSRVTIMGGARLSGEATLAAAGRARVELGGARIAGRSVAVVVTGGARVMRGRSTIEGRVMGNVR